MDVHPELVVVAGFTGRKRDEVEAHLAELADLGVAVPDSVPAFYPAPARLLTQDEVIQVVGGDSSGEAEIALFVDGPERHITLVSDHTDRLVESRDIALSKLVCPKIVASTAWRLDEVADHLDRLVIRSWMGQAATATEPYQEGEAAVLIDPTELLDMVPFGRRPDSVALLGGTLPAIGGIRPAARFRAELTDPVLNRAIGLHYAVEVIDPLVE